MEQGVPFINAGDLINGHIDYHNCKHITSDKFNQLNGAKLKINDIVYCLRGTIGKNGLVNSGANATIASSLVCIRPVKLRPLFLFQILNSSIEERQRKMVDEGAAQPNISATNLKKFLIPVPNDNEQEKIGEVFSKLNHLITLQQRKLEILIKLKRSFLTKSMANSLDKNPELYFNSASVKWLKQKLSDLTIKEFKGNTKLNDTKPGKTEYLDAERLNGNVPLFIDKPINTLKSDILILWDGSKAGSVYYGFEGSLGSTLKAIRLNPKLVNSFFVYQQLKSKQDVIFNKYRTPNIPHVIKNFTKVYPIYFPSIAVQNKIARFLGNLDTLIEIQQKSIKDHKVIKKYLLQKLFI
ncbi:hypothetical protein IMSAG044_00153 [Lactobacillaceae bacterium]|nr:hypothetical protein IMSAG044_00153 [Lactobacillaceae bacterium]